MHGFSREQSVSAWRFACQGHGCSCRANLISKATAWLLAVSAPRLHVKRQRHAALHCARCLESTAQDGDDSEGPPQDDGRAIGKAGRSSQRPASRTLGPCRAQNSVVVLLLLLVTKSRALGSPPRLDGRPVVIHPGMFDHTGEMIATQSAQHRARINVVREVDEGTHDVAHAHVATLKEEMLTIVRTAREMIEQRKNEANRDEIRQELFDLLCNVQLTRRGLKELASELRGSEEALQQIQVLHTTEFIIELLPICNLMHLITSTFALVRAV